MIIGANTERAALLEDGLRATGRGGAAAASAVERIEDSVDPLPRIAAFDPHAILIDLGRPSPDRLQRMLEVARLARRPVAVFVDQSDSGAVHAAIDAGVAAYVVDGLRKERVQPILDVAISRFQAFDRLQRELAEARSALEDRKTIEQAKGILMRQRGLSEEEAYALLRRTAMSQNRKIKELARALVAAAALLDSNGGER